MTLIGAGTGFGQYAMDCGFHNEQITWLGECTFLGAFLGNGIATATGMLLENYTGTGNHSSKNILFDSLFSAAIGLISAGAVDHVFKIKGVNSGKNSFKQVFKSGVTKMKNKGYSMSLKTFMKGVGWRLTEEFSASWFLSSWIQGYLNANN